MIQKPPEIIIVGDSADEVCCDGGGGTLGHPRVWYSFDSADQVECGYCDRAFVKQRSATVTTKSGAVSDA